VQAKASQQVVDVAGVQVGAGVRLPRQPVGAAGCREQADGYVVTVTVGDVDLQTGTRRAHMPWLAARMVRAEEQDRSSWYVSPIRVIARMHAVCRQDPPQSAGTFQIGVVDQVARLELGDADGTQQNRHVLTSNRGEVVSES
jgi:hypothetical protein